MLSLSISLFLLEYLRECPDLLEIWCKTQKFILEYCFCKGVWTVGRRHCKSERAGNLYCFIGGNSG